MASKTRKTTKKDQLIERISNLIRKFVVVPADELLVISHYVLHTHQFSERCRQPLTTPYMYVYSAQKRSGKTLLGIDLLGKLCRNFQGVNNITSATLFRLTQAKCTIAIDEVDMILNSTGSKNDDLISTANSGYKRGGYVPRYDAKAENQVKHFDTFAPKILIGINNAMMKDTLMDRCIPIHMHRATKEEEVTVRPSYEMTIDPQVVQEFEELVADIYQWSFEHTEEIYGYMPTPLDLDNSRAWEIVMPLCQVANVTGYEKELREAVKRIFTAQAAPENSPEIDMLLTIREMFNDQRTDRIRSEEILTRLSTDPRFKGWSPKQLGVKLAPFGIPVVNIRFAPPVGVKRGVKLTDCVDAFDRYLDQ